MKKVLGFFLAGVVGLLAGCGTINSFTAAQLSAAQANASQAVANKQKLDDLKMDALVTGACDINLGALQRNASGNPNAIIGILELCPLPNVGVVKLTNGTINVQTTGSVNGNPFVQPVPAASGAK